MTMTVKQAKSSQNVVIAAIVAAGLLVALGGWFVLVSPQRSHAKSLSAKIDAAQVEIDARQAALSTAHHTQRIRTADLYRLTKAMPDQTDMPDILLQLSQVARETGIEFQSISPDAATAGNGYQVVPINLVFQGNFYDLADFVYRLRNLVGVHNGQLTATGRLFSVDSIDFAEGAQRFPQILATLVVNAYVYGTGVPAAVAPPATGSGATGTPQTSTTVTAPTGTVTVPTSVPPVTASATGATN